MGKKGFFDEMLEHAQLCAMVEASKDESGKPDPNKALGMAVGFGRTSAEDRMHLGAILGSQGAFNDDRGYDNIYLDDTDYDEYGWRDFCEDGEEYGVDPTDYETEEEYEEALEEKKYGWRESCKDGLEYGVDPTDYETEEEYEEALEDEKYGWRDFCEDGEEYGVDPTDYETEEDYEEALEEKKYSWRESCEDGLEYGIDPEDYETEEEYKIDLEEYKREVAETDDLEIEEYEEVNEPQIDKKSFSNLRRYNAACGLEEIRDYNFNNEYLQQERECYQFILEKADTILAANYLSDSGEFLYAQAVKENFDLPITLPDEDENREYEFCEVISKIAKRDISLSIKVWEWCLENFLPYAKYDSCATRDMTENVIDGMYNFPDEYVTELTRYMDQNDGFRENIMENSPGYMYEAYELIVAALKMNMINTAVKLFVETLGQTRGEWKYIIRLTNSMISGCKNYEELETMESFEKELFPLVKKYEDGMIQDEVVEWEKEISEYIYDVEERCEQYAFCRRNSWRLNISDDKKAVVNPMYYKSEEEYMEAYNEEKYHWRLFYKNQNNYGIDPYNYEEQQEFLEARTLKIKEQRKKEDAIRQENLKLKNQELEKDKTVYTYCGVRFSNVTYHYRTNEPTIKVGDIVVVPVGRDEKEERARVVSVGNYARIAVPYPVEKTKFILRKADE